MKVENAFNGSAINRSAGIALAGSLILLFVSSLFYPGIRLVDRVDQTDFVGALAVVADNPILAQLTNVLAIVASLLAVYGFLVLLRTSGTFAGVSGSIARFEIGLGTFTWALFAVGVGTRHMTIHLLQRANQEPEVFQQYMDFASTTHIATAAIFLAWLAIFPMAMMAFGFSLASLCQRLDALKIASAGLGLAATGQLAIYLAALLTLDFDLATMLNVYNSLLFVAGICICVIGFQAVNGSRRLVAT